MVFFLKKNRSRLIKTDTSDREEPGDSLGLHPHFLSQQTIQFRVSGKRQKAALSLYNNAAAVDFTYLDIVVLAVVRYSGKVLVTLH